MVGAVVIACFLMLVLILRAPLLAAIAVVLNLGSVAAAIGVMALVCRIPEGYPLGGHPYVDTVGAAAIFGVTFGLSIDYAVFLLARMRESYERDGDNRAAIEHGLQRTAVGHHRGGRDHGRGLRLLCRGACRDGQPDGRRPDRRGACSTRPSCGSSCCRR